MRFTLPRFLTALGITFVLGIAAVGVLRAVGVIPPGLDPEAPEALIAEAEAGLAAVADRDTSDRRPASYDAILLPLDKLLLQAKALIEGDGYDAAADFDTLRGIVVPVIDIATRADAAAREETSFLAKEYRFNTQKGDASQYLANAMWERTLRSLPRRDGFFPEGADYPPHEMEALMAVLNEGLAAAPENAQLYYIRGVVNRAQGLFGPAARDLESAVTFDTTLDAAWNVLGLVRINLKEFDKAEEALERSRVLAQENAERNGTVPGAEYTAIVYNLAAFHEGLAAFYSREYRVTPTVESQRLTERHSADARRYYGEFLQREPEGSPDAALARAKMDALP